MIVPIVFRPVSIFAGRSILGIEQIQKANLQIHKPDGLVAHSSAGFACVGNEAAVS